MAFLEIDKNLKYKVADLSLAAWGRKVPIPLEHRRLGRTQRRNTVIPPPGSPKLQRKFTDANQP